MEKSGEIFKNETVNPSIANLYLFPKYKYTFKNGNFLYFTAADHNSRMGGSNYLVIGYTYENTIHAKQLQRELDRLLSERDLIYAEK